MKVKILILLFVFISVYRWLSSTTWHIKQDGTGNFYTIQEGIDASADSDTVLVYPGTYYENIDFSGKNINVASLYLTTQNEQYVNETIIDGNQNGSCVRIISGEDSTTVFCGFTITNGSGSAYFEDGPICGGGILLMETHANITYCIIKNNNSHWGGGIFCRLSQISLSEITITNNHAGSGGGVFSREDSEINFDQTELCNIFLNYAADGCEIFKTYSSPPMEVYVDTFTVFEPDGYFIRSVTTSGVPLNDVTLFMQNAKFEPVNNDLYVSTEGNNNNCGLSADEPLSTINYALSLVKSDTLHPNTIHIAGGTYSKFLNNNCFPLCMRGYVSLVGESMENTILDAESNSPHIYDSYSKLDYSIKNITFVNGNGLDFFSAVAFIKAQNLNNKYVIMEDISINECIGYSRNIYLSYMDIYIKNLYSYFNNSACLGALNSHQPEQVAIIENIYINNNAQYNPTSPYSDAKAQLAFGMLGTLPMNVTITNMELTENVQYQSDWPESSSGFGIGDNVNLNLINCTIGNNASPGNGGAIRIGPAGQNSTLNIYNSILYGDLPGEIYIDNEFSANPSTLNIQNSLVDGGFEGIENIYSWNTVNWLEGNLDTIPQWTGTGNYPYALSTGSPCIDAGTLDLPPGIELPEYDLAGNPRIYGETIDMGAYEWQGTPVENYEFQISNFKLNNYPNPFNPSTIIKLDLAESGKVELAIYNIKGQKIKTLMDAYSSKGIFELVWRGTDDNKKKAASGNYFIKLKINGKEKAVRKMVLLK